MLRTTALAALLALAEAAPQGMGGGGTTMLRFGCTQTVIDRLDPLVNPGQLPSPHVHQVVGGNAFNATMPSADISKLATCTTCQFSEDFSNYWTANLYFRARNGSLMRVKQGSAALQFGDRFSNQIDGGVLVYYVSAAPGKITAFKPGFRMLVGDAGRKTPLPATMRMQNCFRCYTGPNYGGDIAAPCQGGSVDSTTFPQKKCYGVRSNILFPTCWDGKNLDTPNHQDHVAYPTGGPATFLSLGSGNCPTTHPVRIPQIMLEVVWKTDEFNDQSIWPEDGKPFVFSDGDKLGYAQHADYVFGWKDDSLQKAMDRGGCMGARCGDLKTQTIDQAKSCKVKNMVHENVDGWISGLPGDDGTAMNM